MIALLAAVGWGLLAFGAVTHVWHHKRLRELLARHIDRPVVPAAVLTTVEAGLSVVIPIAFIADAGVLPLLGVAATVLATGFVFWIARLLASGSDLPCACSFSESPTSGWSLARASIVCLVALFAIVSPNDLTNVEAIATLVAGWAVAAAVFVLPEALSWPDASRALMTRVDAHTNAS